MLSYQQNKKLIKIYPHLIKIGLSFGPSLNNRRIGDRHPEIHCLKEGGEKTSKRIFQ